MWTLLVVAIVLAPSTPTVSSAADTVVAVDRGTRLEVENWRGQVVVQGWDRDAVRIQATGAAGARPDIVRAGTILRVRGDNGPTRPARTDFTLTVPRWMDLRVHGQQIDVDVRGVGGDVAVETVSGSVRVEGGSRVTVRTIQGGVSVRNTQGRVQVWSVGDGVRIENVTGEISAETTNGAIALRGIRSVAVRASTVNGSVSFQGTIQDDGLYSFATHNGGIDIEVHETVNATVSAATYNGSFRADFPVRLTGMSRDRHYNFTLGSGRARLELESFNGDITLRRPR
jgi:DUF4097 and DUF4098 domain-containing protein YvlB